MSESSDDWREKYRELVEEQEQAQYSQQKAFDQQLGLMRKALVRVSLAAEGRNTALDKSLDALRECLRTDGNLASIVEQLEGVLIENEPIPDTSDNPVPVIEGELELATELTEDTVEGEFQRPVHEPAFSRVSDRVRRILEDLLSKVAPAPDIDLRVADIRESLDRGLNWFELVPVLEDVRDLVLDTYLRADRDYHSYLSDMHSTLEETLKLVGGAVESYQQQFQLDQQFEEDLQYQLGSLAHSAELATEVDSLKRGIESHLDAIRGALAERRQNGQQQVLEQQLKSLSQQLEQAEQAASHAQEALQEESRKAVTDSLTGLPNREAYRQKLEQEFSRWQRYGRPLALVMCDIDHFKSINDRYGHRAGDRVLQVLSKALSQRLRKVDFLARYGGEEFVVLLPETDGATAFALMDKIRDVIADTPFRFKEDPVQVTLSMGVADFNEGDDVETVFERADQLLYKAKAEGRNRCLIS